MNKRTVGVIIFVLVALVFGLVYQFTYRANHTPIYIAVMVPGEQSSLKSTQRTITSIQMYLDEVNARGGINGHTLQLIIKEDRNTVEGALKSLDELAQENEAMVILGNTYSNPAIAIGPKLTRVRHSSYHRWSNCSKGHREQSLVLPRCTK